VGIELTTAEEAQLRQIAAKTGRDVRVLVEEAIRQYADSIAITDLNSEDVAEVQLALVAELPGISSWKARTG